jgi:hypothetical protein
MEAAGEIRGQIVHRKDARLAGFDETAAGTGGKQAILRVCSDDDPIPRGE